MASGIFAKAPRRLFDQTYFPIDPRDKRQSDDRTHALEAGRDTGVVISMKNIYTIPLVTAERDWLAQVDDSDLRRGGGCSNYATLPNLYRAIACTAGATVINRIYISYGSE